MWQPRISVFDERGAKTAIINYFKANQAAALLWANDQKPLPPIAEFFAQNIFVAGKLPLLFFNRTAHTSSFEDILEIQYAIDLEVWIAHGKQEYLSAAVPKYAMAIESLLSNLPDSTLAENGKIKIAAQLRQLETTLDAQVPAKKSGFLQRFQTSAQWTIEASAYGN